MKKTNLYVCQLNESEQAKVKQLVKNTLTEEGLTGIELDEAIANAMDSRLCDLEDLIELDVI